MKIRSVVLHSMQAVDDQTYCFLIHLLPMFTFSRFTAAQLGVVYLISSFSSLQSQTLSSRKADFPKLKFYFADFCSTTTTRTGTTNSNMGLCNISCNTIVLRTPAGILKIFEFVSKTFVFFLLLIFMTTLEGQCKEGRKHYHPDSGFPFFCPESKHEQYTISQSKSFDAHQVKI